MRARALGATSLVVGAAALVAWCGWASGFHRTSAAAEVTWLCSLGAVLAVDLALRRGHAGRRSRERRGPVVPPWPRPGHGGSRRALVGTAPWALLLVVALAWDLLGLDSGPHEYHLTLSALSQAYRPLDAGLLLCWMLVGVGYQVARVRGRRPGSGTAGSSPTTDPPRPLDRGGVAWGAGGVGHGFAPGLLLPQRPAVGVAFWLAVPAAAVVVDQLARRSGGRIATAEEFVRFVSTSPVANAVCVAAWVLAGFHLFAR